MYILASQSPRRKELLSILDIEFKVVPSNVDEIINNKLSMDHLVIDLAKQKAEHVFKSYPQDTIIGCDTIVVLDNTIMGKPKSKDAARMMLQSLSNNTHHVYTGVYVINKDNVVKFSNKTAVTFWDISDMIESFINTDEPYDKAGGYGIQGKAGLFVKSIDGDYYSVMGLPISELKQKLKEGF